jgi:hypothetical protein
MKTISVKVYPFDELSDQAKKVAIENYYDHYMGDWWDYIYEDASQMSISIREFDVYRRYCKVDFVDSAIETHEAIIEAGVTGQLKDIADDWKEEVDNLAKSYSNYDEFLDWLSDRGFTEDDFDFDHWLLYESGYADDRESVDYDFLKQIAECYLTYLSDTYDYYTSEEYISSFYDDHDALFFESGKEAPTE